MGRRTRRLVLGLIVSSFLFMGVQAAAAATLVVDDDGVPCSAPDHTTIQAAINAAAPGGTIEVCAGFYPELAPGPLTVNKPLTLEGEQAGVDARNPRGAESIINDLQGTFVTASNVVIDGFTVQNSSVSAFTGFGIAMGAGTTGTRIVNNIIQDNIVGIGLANSGASPVLIRHNLIRNNNRPGGASGTGIYTDQFVCGTPCRNFVIDENDFKGHALDGIDVSNTGASAVTDLEVSENDFDMNGRALVLFNTDMSSFHDNSVTNSTFAASAAIRLFGVNDLTILNNDLIVGGGHAIRNSAFLGQSSNVEIHQNNIEFFGLTGLTVDPLSHVGPVDAECNWWNSPSGPTAVTNPGGTGEEVVGDADFTPWLTARAPGGPCFGGVPSTPGKVTGGGQTEGDPLFSPFGDLLSLPALVPSLSSSSSQATFGFNVKCCPETGNLQYNDHQAGVRIKALSFDGLFITGGTCGPNTHATFTGEAEVTRSTGTTMETLTVEVDDCDEPGTMDTFGIETDTYSDPPSTLIGGNIQIH